VQERIAAQTAPVTDEPRGHGVTIDPGRSRPAGR
jgi:hypothetical protein